MAKHKQQRETANPIGMKINEVMLTKGMSGDYAAVAEYFDVKVPSVYGWVDTGRISKSRLPALAVWSGRPVSWWLGSEELVSALEDWRLQASSRSQAVIDTLTLLAKKNKLRDEDWLLIEQMVQRFAQK